MRINTYTIIFSRTVNNFYDIVNEIQLVYLLLFFFLLNITNSNATVYTVTTTADAGVGSLRDAITSANGNSGPDVIQFNIGAGPGPYTIFLSSALPAISDVSGGLTIDGTTETGWTDNTVLPKNATSGTPMNTTYRIIISHTIAATPGISITSDNNIIKGVVIQSVGTTAVSTGEQAISISGNNNQVLACYIGMNYSGTNSGTTSEYGIYITGAGNIIGDGTAAGANLISGLHTASGYGGIILSGSGATDNIIKGNIIGLQNDGTTICAREQYNGIIVTSGSTNNTIGGTAANDGNVISGNQGQGVLISSDVGANTIIGNIIGPRSDGITIVTNNKQQSGISISSSPNNIIGGSTANERNVISANTANGILITGAGSTGNYVKGNYISIAADGASHIAGSGQYRGVYLFSSCAYNTIGGSITEEKNVISCSVYTTTAIPSQRGGIAISGSANNIIKGNIIGLQANGITITGVSQDFGINLHGNATTTANIIGGTAAGERNIISGNLNGVAIATSGLAGPAANIIKGNYIGLASDGVSLVAGNIQEKGVYITAGTSNIIGGTNPGEGNVISGQGNTGLGIDGYGILIANTSSFGNEIYGNIIGPQKDGSTYVTGATKQQYGIYINNSKDNTIGTNSSVKNIISANETAGVYIANSSASGNLVIGNYIGTASDGTSIITSATQDYGVYITTSANNNTIGGTTSGFENIIAHNVGDGVFITGAATSGNIVRRNLIYGNTGKAINLDGSGNLTKAAPVVNANFTGASCSGTASPGDIIEVYESIISSSVTTIAVCQSAEVYQGTTIADVSGNWSLGGYSVPLSANGTPIAIAMDASGNTSEFGCPPSVSLPIELIYFDAKKFDDYTVKTYWQTATEINNDYFTVERSVDGVDFRGIGSVDGAGNSSSVISYQLLDNEVSQYLHLHTLYYRLKQIDFDGSYSYSRTVALSLENSSASIFDFDIVPNPTREDNINVALYGVENEEVLITVRNILGKELYAKTFLMSEKYTVIKLKELTLTSGVYTIIASSKGKIVTRRIVIQYL